jgi:transcriptional regulator with XRE-family HTH domain
MDGSCCVGKPIADQSGCALRRARQARGLTLRNVGIRSGGIFTPTAVAGYERGERSISLERFCELATFYGVRPEDLLAEALCPHDRQLIVDLTSLGERVDSSSG